VLDAMWRSMDLEGRPGRTKSERERRAARRKEERAAAVQSILATRAEAERAFSRFAQANKGPPATARGRADLTVTGTS
jgi:hypothetical protein